MRVRAVVALMVAMVAGACGTGGDDKPSLTPTVAAADLAAALPVLDDVPGAESVIRCPVDTETCSGDTGGAASALFVVPHVNDAAEQQAREAAQLDGDVAYLIAYNQSDPERSRTEWQEQRTENEKAYAGEYTIAADGARAGERGTGEVVPLPVDGWDGTVTTRSIALPTGPLDEPALLNSEIALIRGSTRIDVRVTLSAGGRADDAASALAVSLARGYVERLG